MSHKIARTCIALLLLIWIAACIPLPGRATTLARMSLTELARSADTIVQVRCLSAAAGWDRGTIWTFAAFELLDTFKGAPPKQITVRVPGGRVANVVAFVEAAPQFRQGDEVILFLEKNADGDYSVTAWSEGTFRVHRTPDAGRVTVTQDSTRFAVFDQTARQFRTDGVRDLPFDQFHRRLAAAVGPARPGASR